MPKNKSLMMLGALLVGAVVVIASMILFIGPLFEHKPTSDVCTKAVAHHTATIQNNKIVPSRTYAKKCDTLTIANNDTITRLMAFGEHEHHIVYDGVNEKRLGPHESFKIELNQTGTYIFHDHYDESVSADFTVTD